MAGIPPGQTVDKHRTLVTLSGNALRDMQRPPAVTTFGVLNIAFAIFGVLGIFATVALLSADAMSNNPVVTIIRDNPSYAAWMKVTIPLGLLSCAALLAAGIGLLLLKEWARKLSIGYAIYAILFGLLGVVLNFVFLTRPMLEQASQRQGPEAAGAVGGAIGSSIGGCFGLIYPILLFIFMTRPKVVAAFRPATAPPSLPPS